MTERLRWQNDNGPLEVLPDVRQGSTFKPVGLWYSVGNEWAEWCKSEGFRDTDAQTCYRLEVDESKILRLTTPEEILAFTAEYSIGTEFWGIDWARLAGEYGGIEIAPYSWELRYDNRTSWYYTWDVASGCLWDPEALVKAEVIG